MPSLIPALRLVTNASSNGETINLRDSQNRRQIRDLLDAVPAVKRQEIVSEGIAAQALAPVSTTPTLPTEPKCSITASQEDPAKILQVLSIQTGYNLIFLGKSENKVTLQLKDVPLTEMLRHLCAMCDVASIRMGQTFVLATPERLKAAYPAEWEHDHPTVKVVESVVLRTTDTYRTNYVSATQIAEVLSKIYPAKDLNIVAGPTSITPDLGQQDNSKSTGSSTSVLTKGTTGSTGSDFTGSRVVVVSGPTELVSQAIGTAKQLDQPRTQVCIAVKIDDISNDALKEIGLSWSFGSVGLTETTPSGLSFGSFNRAPQTMTATLDMLEQNNRAKLLAAPSISLLDGERAFVLIGNRISYPVLVGYSQSNSPVFTKEEERVGIYLQVAATVGSDNSVTLSLYPQVSSVTSYLNINGASYPQISTREAQSTLRLQTGESLVMGGLFKDEEVQQLEKVPILGDIPFLKELFNHRKITRSSSQVIITVTPTIIKPTTK